MNKSACAIIAGTLLIVLSNAPAVHAAPIAIESLDRTTPVDFQSEILPLLRVSCLACHNAQQAEGELNLETPAAIRQGGSRGSAVAEDSEMSLLLRAAAHQDDDLVMPPPDNKAGAAPLTPRQLGLLRLWIKQGARGEVSSEQAIAWRPLPPQLTPIFAAAITPDGKFAACSRGARLSVYHLPTQQLAAELRDAELSDSAAQGNESAAAHLDVIRSLAFDDAGEWLASGGFRTVKLWRRPHVAKLSESKLDAAITAAALARDGKLSAFGDAGGRIVLCSAETGKQVGAIDAHRAAVTGLAFTADGTTLVSSSTDKTLRLWNAADGKPLATIDTPAEINALALVGEALLVTGHQDKRIRVWEMAKLVSGQSGAEASIAPLREIDAHEGAVTALASDLDDNILSGGEDGTVRLWNARTGEQIKQFAHGGPVSAIALSSNKKRIASAGGGLVKLFGADDGSLVTELKGDPRQADRVLQIEADIAFTQSTVELTRRDIKLYEGPERRVKVTAEAVTKAEEELAKAEKALKEKQQALEKVQADEKKRESAEKGVKDAESARDVVLTIIERAKAVARRAEEELEEANAVVSNGEAKLEKLETQKAAAEKAAAENDQPVHGLAFSPDGGQLLVAKGDCLHVYTADGSPLRSIADHAAAITATAMANSGSRFLTAGQDGQSVVYQVETEWKLARTIGDVESANLLVDRVSAVAFQPGGRLLATGGGLASRGGELKLWNAADGQLVLDLSAAHADTVLAAAFSPDGELLASGGADNLVQVHRVADGKLVATLPGHTAHVLGVSFSGDGKLLASCGGDRVVKLWDVAAGRQLETMVGTMYKIGRYRQEVTAVRFVGDSEQIIAASGDGTMRLHRTSSDKEILVYEGSSTWLYSAAASADGRAVIAGGADGVLRLWSAQDRSPKATFP
ncbi:MAG: c-type cytochrome domain-containing protein [Pirellulaceae bacterium]